MKYMSFNDSDILREFGRIMQEKDGLTKIAQAVAPLSEEEKAKLEHFLGELRVSPANGPGMERWMERLQGQKDPYLSAVHYALAQRHALWAMGKGNEELQAILLPAPITPSPVAPQPDNMAGKPAGQPLAAIPQTRASLSQRQKLADQKAYEVTPKEDMVQEAHPQTAKVEGDVVENLNEQHAADKAVAEKSAKQVLTALYKLAKRLQEENHEEAYKLVKATFLDISKSLKK